MKCGILTLFPFWVFIRGRASQTSISCSCLACKVGKHLQKYSTVDASHETCILSHWHLGTWEAERESSCRKKVVLLKGVTLMEGVSGVCEEWE